MKLNETPNQGASKMNTQEIINEATKLGQDFKCPSEVQDRALELEKETGLTFHGGSPERSQEGTPANILWTTYHEARAEAYEERESTFVPWWSVKLTAEQKTRAKEIANYRKQESLDDFIWKYRERSSYARRNPTPMSTLRKWNNEFGPDLRKDQDLRVLLKSVGEL
tara:strand:+ start:8211 stop:8711 length:501 start_codon:yes stop_codon:yes gene_type:complete